MNTAVAFWTVRKPELGMLLVSCPVGDLPVLSPSGEVTRTFAGGSWNQASLEMAGRLSIRVL